MTKTAARPEPEKPKETLRDFVEQIVVAVLLALLIRGFDVEAFVIPTGSMAPTLMGRHKEITCPQCGNVYAVNSSEETAAFLAANPQARASEAAICVNCRFPTLTGEAPSFKGDRILVMKFPFELPFLPGSGGPDRWDVVVFHYPERPEQNYIKRLVGRPGEELRLNRGDIYTRPTGTDETFRIARKPTSRLKAMAILVNDDRHRATLLKDRPEWLRWRATEGCSESKDGLFTFDGDGAGKAGSLRYRHVAPDPEQWIAVAQNRALPRPARPSLITDFYSYNASTLAEPGDQVSAWLQSNWVGDLLVEFDLRLDKVGPDGRFSVELTEAGIRNRCEINPSTGLATLYHGDQKLGEATTRITGPGSYRIGFANFDDRQTLWVDGRTPFGDGLPYEDAPTDSRGPKAEDLQPAGITSAGVGMQVSGLVLKRDIYYTQDARRPDVSIDSNGYNYNNPDRSQFARVTHLFDVLSDPAKFVPLLANSEPGEPYPIKPGNYMMMGDNSPRSSDSRAWGRLDREWDRDRSRWEVPREMLIGKAFFVYWPHGVPFGPEISLSRDFKIPFRPYVERMRPIR